MDRAEPRPEPRIARDRRPRRRPGPAIRAGLILAMAASAVAATPLPAIAQPGGALKDVAFEQKNNAQIPLDIPFRDQVGQPVRLFEFFGKRPVILVMGYSNCPLLCSQVLNQLTRSLRALDPSVGKEFDIVTVSIDPAEKPERADHQRRGYLKRYNRPGSESGWHALTGEKESIDRLARSVGFQYTFNPRLNIYAHAAGFVLLTPGGKVSRYFFGVDFPAREIKPALAEASAGRVGSPIEKLLLYCYDYDPNTGKYTFAIMNAIRVLGVATALALGTFLFAMVRRDRRMARATGTKNPDLTPGPAIL